MYYFFGAGNNCWGALRFFGKENVIAIIDNNTARIGTLFESVPIISFEDFLNMWRGEMILITAYLKSDEIVKQLEAVNISNYFVCPFMQSGFLSCEEIIKTYDLLNYSTIAVYDKNPIAEALAAEIKKENKCTIQFIDDNCDKLNAELLLIIKDEFDGKHQFSGYKRELDLFTELKRNKNKRYSNLAKYKNIHKGKRCFVLGNGPSMNINDLEKIYKANEISFASNSMYKIFDSTKWRPTYYAMADSIVYIRNKESLPQNIICFIRDFDEQIYEGENINIYNAIAEKYYPGYPQFSDDIVRAIYGGRTVTYDMLQIAAYMGFHEIYLLGVDFTWGEDGKSTHFYNNKEEDVRVKNAIMYKDEVKHAYISAKNFADSHRIKIYNATRGGKLEVFERVDFDGLFDFGCRNEM